MLLGFALYQEPAKQEPAVVAGHDVIGTPPGTRLMRIIREPMAWKLWVSTRDYVFGTTLHLHNDGTIVRVTTRVDEGDEEFFVRPSDQAIKDMQG